MSLEALRQYAEEQNQATQAEVNKIIGNEAHKGAMSNAKIKANTKPPVSKENVTEAIQERVAGLYKDQAERIRVSERLRIEITKGLNNGKDPSSILLTALECISLMTGDKLFYEQNMKVLNGK